MTDLRNAAGRRGLGDPQAMDRAKRTFYTLMGWDPVSGVPSQETLDAPGIGWAAPEACS